MKSLAFFVVQRQKRHKTIVPLSLIASDTSFTNNDEFHHESAFSLHTSVEGYFEAGDRFEDASRPFQGGRRDDPFLIRSLLPRTSDQMAAIDFPRARQSPSTPGRFQSLIPK